VGERVIPEGRRILASEGFAFELQASGFVESSQVCGSWGTDSDRVGSWIEDVVRSFFKDSV
jgi:hypothetical protein